MHPIIVLEGPDGSGKSTLAKVFQERYGAHYMHLTYRFKKQMFTYHTAALELAMKHAKHGPVVLDRWWPSINIYDHVFRKRLDFPQASRMLDRAGLPQGVIYVVCLPSDREQHLAAFEEKKAKGLEMYDTVVEVVDEYADWYESVKHRHDVVRYDMYTDGQDMKRFVENTWQRAWQMQNRIPAWFQQNRQMGGQFINPKMLIVGEKSNPKGRHKVWPFFEHANSSLWVTQVLDDCGIGEEDIIWANAIDEQGWTQPKLLDQIYRQTEPKAVLALGRKAETVCFAAGLRNLAGFEHLPHPAYAKRFLNGDPREFVEALNRARNYVTAANAH